MATTKPVKVLWVGDSLPPELVALREDGHTVSLAAHVNELGDFIQEYDLVMGPKCWRIASEHMKFLPLAIKEARAAMPKRVKKK